MQDRQRFLKMYQHARLHLTVVIAPLDTFMGYQTISPVPISILICYYEFGLQTLYLPILNSSYLNTPQVASAISLTRYTITAEISFRLLINYLSYLFCGNIVPLVDFRCAGFSANCIECVVNTISLYTFLMTGGIVI